MKKALLVIAIIITTSILLLVGIYQVKLWQYKDECTFTDQQGTTKTVEYLRYDGCNTTSCTESGLITTEKYCTAIGKFLGIF